MVCQLDGDLSFMVSLLSTIKSMNEKQKINFKIGVLQLMSRIKFDEGQNNPAGVASVQSTVAISNHNCSPAPRKLQQVAGVKRMLPKVKKEVVDTSPGSSSWCYNIDSNTEEDIDFTLAQDNYKPS